MAIAQIVPDSGIHRLITRQNRTAENPAMTAGMASDEVARMSSPGDEEPAAATGHCEGGDGRNRGGAMDVDVPS